ncbi:VPLPA-CTERM sorting domain-containing protein [Sedimentitalea sp. JM2-8]|uniref:VPLPA-CTERM sorting domain-containing protein n=1 Tax=Sedimentitalea xiamensis TaxID=3050037 RepID=A0ABT7FIU8_9RHOB|nr:VPLPA-CTERM sorting domain-containing protein [Sedimentitalea xiamensis]MDK3075062.1 VPLPA-CTERM sorting domain-containing protein [Sedimentitalea xiamensis]
MKSIFTSFFAVMLAHPLHALTVTDQFTSGVPLVWSSQYGCQPVCSEQSPSIVYSHRFDNDMPRSWVPAYSPDMGRLERVSFAMDYSFRADDVDFVTVGATPTFWGEGYGSWTGPDAGFSGRHGSTETASYRWDLDADNLSGFASGAIYALTLVFDASGFSEHYSSPHHGGGDIGYDLTVTYHISPVPLPASFPLLAVVVLGLGALGIAAGRRRNGLELSASGCA